MNICKLKNKIQNYAWGSQTSMQELFGFENADNSPQAELWMGAHEQGCSIVAETGQPLVEYIELEKDDVLGSATAIRFGSLPYLFKVLAAHTPLSIQVHPNKEKSEIGFSRENSLGIALDAPERNYKDPNHKPELVYALTHYKAMNGFRPFSHIIALFEEFNISELAIEVEEFKQQPDAAGLEALFTALMTLEGQRKLRALEQLSSHYQRTDLSPMAQQVVDYSRNFAMHYQDDIGLLAPLVLNIVELAPRESMFLHAETPHAYVQGTALEIMASSDNVLRAGLTPKHIDVEELVANTLFEPIDPSDLKLAPEHLDGRFHFPVPVEDFKFEVLTPSEEERSLTVESAEILFCIEGEAKVCSDDDVEILKPGDSVLIPYKAKAYTYTCTGRIARAFN